MRNFFFFIIYITGSIPALQGQERMYRNFTVQDGLPSNNVYSTVQDADGYMWFCTDAGVSRFDGKKFVNYTVQDGLLSNEIFSASPTRSGKLFFNCYKKGVCYYEKGRIFNASSEPWLDKKNYFGTALAVDGGDNVWYTTSDYYTNYKLDIAGRQLAEVKNVPGKPFYAVYNGLVDTLSYNQYQWLMNEMQQLIRLIAKKHSQNTATEILSLVLQESRNWPADCRTTQVIRRMLMALWENDQFSAFRIFRRALINADTSVVIYSETEGALYYPHLPLPGEQPMVLFPGKFVSWVYRDKDGNLWVSTLNEGVFMLRNNEAYSYNNRLPSKSIYSLAVYDGQRLVTGLNDQAGLFDGSTYSGIWSGLPEKRKGNYAGLYNRIKSIYSANGIMYLGTDMGLKWVDTRTGRIKLVGDQHNTNGHSGILSIKDICPAARGGIYYSYHAGLGYADEKGNNRSLHDRIRTTSVYEAPDGVLWVSSTDGIYRFIKENTLEKILFASGTINSYIVSLAGMGPYVLAGSNGEGCYIIRGGRYEVITNKQLAGGLPGLTSGICRRIVVRDSTSFWVCTNKGLNLVHISSWQPFRCDISRINASDGLISDDVNDVKELNGRVWVATGNGLFSFNGKDITRQDVPPRVTMLNAAAIHGQEFSSGRRLTFEFSGVSMQSMGDISYHYRLLGLSDEWDTTRQEQVQYALLPHGDYEMQVYAVSRNGVRSKQYASAAFTVLKPWWQRSGNIALFALALLLLLFLGYRQVAAVARRREKKKQEHLNQVQQLEMKALRSQMNPHFIFNSMNSVQKYILGNDTDAACRYVSAFSMLIRQVLENARHATISLQNEIALLEAYVQLEQQRFKQKFTYSIKCGPGVVPAALRLPPMLIQPFVENAIWHGIQNIGQEGRISILFTRYSGDVLLCTVEDNGIGRKEHEVNEGNSGTAKHRSLGVSITGQRLDILNGTRNHGVNIRYSTPPDGNGTRVEIFIVCNNNQDDKSNLN